MRVAAAEVLRRYALATSAGHTRSLPNRGPCLLTPLGPADASAPRPTAARLAAHARCATAGRTCGAASSSSSSARYMVWDARRLRLCRNYFAAQEAGR